MTRALTREFKKGDIVKHQLGHSGLLLDIIKGTDRFGNSATMLKVLYFHPKEKVNKIRMWEWTNVYVFIPVD